MRLRKSALLLFVALLLVAFAVAMAQTPTQGDQKKSEACCSMEACCCNGGSCPMKQEGASADAKDAHCCCSGDACEMKAGENAKNHADHPCCNDSCEMKKHDSTKHDSKKHDGKADCCNVKNKAKSKKAA